MNPDRIPPCWEFVRFGIPDFGDYYINACGCILQRPMYREWFMDYGIDRTIIKPSGEGIA